MYRFYVLPLLILLSLTVMFAAAQDDPMPDNDSPLPTPSTEDIAVEDAETKPLEIGSLMSSGGGVFSINVSEGSDFCSTATEVTESGGVQFDVAEFTQSANDPILNCMWGSPSDLRGYRTVWYKFTPDANGIMTINTLPSSPSLTTAYDTVLAVHTGECDGSLTTVACNDDTMGFSSEITMNVRRNTPYYIEIADWQPGGNAIKTLNIFLSIDPFDSFWQVVDPAPQNFIGTSRHASVVVGSDIYFLGGRGANGNLLSNVQKLNTNTGTWTQMVSIPGDGLVNTTAVYLPPGASTGTQGRIYIPGGSASASDDFYTRDHYVYDFATGIWSTAGTSVGGAHVSDAFAYAVAVPNNARDGYFLTGGVVGPGYPITTTSQTRDQVLFYQPSSDTWFDSPDAMQSPRYGHVAANINGSICVAGGLNLLTATDEIELVTRVECASGVDGTGWATIAAMNIPRYFAHSSVTPDGRWIVYGGIDGTGVATPEVEVYDPSTNTWSVLGLAYDLGGQNGMPLVWPGGGFVGNYLWTAGGSYDLVGNSLNPQLAKVQILGGHTYLPVILNMQDGNNHTFDTAWPRPYNSAVWQNFTSTREFVNVYSFNINQLKTVQVALRDVASTANLSLYVYGENKQQLASSESPFERDKTITMPMAPGKYYVIVRYVSSSPEDVTDSYWLGIGDAP